MRLAFRTLRIDDARVLHSLVKEHVDSLEADLKILDERVLLGGGTVDLVAVDAQGRLVLIAIAFVAENGMLLRMLEAYAWCLEYPDTVSRLYALPPTSLAAPPRVVFIGERLSDAFLQKVKHLRMPSIDCLEFRYIEVNGAAGLYLNPLDPPRPAPTKSIDADPEPILPATPTMSASASSAPTLVDPQVAPSSPPPSTAESRTPIERAAVTVVAVEPVANGGEVTEPTRPAAPMAPTAAPSAADAPATGKLSANLLKGLQLPPNLSSEWRRVLTRTPDEPDSGKLRMVREYLQGEFPGCVIYNSYEHQRAAHVFYVQNSGGVNVHVIAVSSDLLATDTEVDIRRFLERNRLARALRDAGSAGVLITPSGFQVAKG